MSSQTTTALSPSLLSSSSTSTSTPCYYRLTVPTFFMGAIIALFSQFVLQYTFYGVNTNFIQHILYSSANATALSICKVILFSISWSFMTCIIVFLGMVVSMQLIESIFMRPVPTTTNKTITNTSKSRINDIEDVNDEENEDETDNTLFAMEIAYVFGAIAAIILLWTVFDFGLVIYPTATTASSSSDHMMNIDHSFMFFLYQSPLCVVFMSMMITVLVFSATSMIIHLLRCLYQKHTTNCQVDAKDDVEDVEESMIPTTLSYSPSPVEWFIYCIASTVGLMVGMGTQMILSLILWSNVNQIPFVVQTNLTIAMFSFGWSTVTVIVTALACYLLRRIVVQGIVPYYMHRNISIHYQSLLVVRMEAMYIGWTLTGICIGWIVLDIVHHMASQIYISIILFILSLSSFGCILYYFPEQNVDSDEDMDEDTMMEPLLLTEDLSEMA